MQAFYESDGKENRLLWEPTCKDLNVIPIIPSAAFGMQTLKDALFKGRPGTVDKVIKATFVGTVELKRGKQEKAILHVEAIRDLSVSDGPNPFFEAVEPLQK